MKLIAKTLVILLMMAGGSWLSGKLSLYLVGSGNLRILSAAAMYAVYFIIGIFLGGMANPRYTKSKDRHLNFFPIVIFGLIGVMQILYLVLPGIPFSWITAYLAPFAYLSWTLTGLFVAFALR